MWRDDFPDNVTAALMETYYGGRTECRIRKVAVPGTYLDFLSQYPTVFVLMGMWSYLIADRLSWESVNPDSVQRFVDHIRLSDLFDKRTWRQLQIIVRVDPDGDLLPTRARYGTSPVFNVGINYRSGEPQYWTLADVITSRIALGKSPRILSAYRFEAIGRQAGLTSMRIGDITVDPATEDLIQRLVEGRGSLKARAAEDAANRDLLLAQAQGVKIAANSIAYGSAIEMNVIEQLKPALLEVWLPDGTKYDARPSRTERTGRWFNPVVATLVSAGGRLLLAMGIQCLRRLGGEYAMCDTDSLFVVSTRQRRDLALVDESEHTATQLVEAVSWGDVDRIVADFHHLNPYDGRVGSTSILQIEPVNFEPESGRRIIECLAIASKRYVLFVRSPDDAFSIIARKEHGLGHLMDPTAGQDLEGGWIDRWWEHVLGSLLGQSPTPPGWFALPAVGRMSITAPREEAAFACINDRVHYAQRIRPSNFIVVARPHRLQKGPPLLVAPYEPDPTRWMTLAWSDRAASFPRGYKIRTTNPEIYSEGEISVQTYGDYFDDFILHPEVKSTDPDGTPCHPWSQGLLGHRHVTVRQLARIGKESNRLLDRPELQTGLVSYGSPRDCATCGKRLSGTRAKYCSAACKQKAYRASRASRA